MMNYWWLLLPLMVLLIGTWRIILLLHAKKSSEVNVTIKQVKRRVYQDAYRVVDQFCWASPDTEDVPDEFVYVYFEELNKLLSDLAAKGKE